MLSKTITQHSTASAHMTVFFTLSVVNTELQITFFWVMKLDVTVRCIQILCYVLLTFCIRN